MAGYRACVFGASTELGRLVVRELLKRSEIDVVYALAVLDIRDMLELSPRHMEKLQLKVKPLERLLSTLRSVPDIELAFCCMGSSKAAYTVMGSVEFHRRNLEFPLRFVQEMFERDVMRIEILGHAKANSKSRSDFARVKGEFEDAVRRLHRGAGMDGPGVTLFKVPFLLTSERCQEGERGRKITKNEIFRQRFAVRLGVGPAGAVHVRDIAKAMRIDALMNATAIDEGTGADLILYSKQTHFTEVSGPEIVDMATRVRMHEAAERANAREHRYINYRMAARGHDDQEFGLVDEGMRPHSLSRRIPRQLNPEDDFDYEGEDDDNPFLSDSQLENVNPSAQNNVEHRTGGISNEITEIERATLASFNSRTRLRKEAAGAGSIQRLKGQQKKDILSLRRENAHVPSPVMFGRPVRTGQQKRMGGSSSLQTGRAGGPAEAAQRMAAVPPMQSGRSGGSAAVHGRRPRVNDQHLSSPRQSERQNIPAPLFRTAEQLPSQRRSSVSRAQHMAGNSSFGASARHSFAGSGVRRSSSAYSNSRRQSMGRVSSGKQSGGVFAAISGFFLARKERPVQSSSKPPRRRSMDLRDTGYIDI